MSETREGAVKRVRIQAISEIPTPSGGWGVPPVFGGTLYDGPADLLPLSRDWERPLALEKRATLKVRFRAANFPLGDVSAVVIDGRRYGVIGGVMDPPHDITLYLVETWR